MTDLNQLLKLSLEKLAAMTPAERDAMYKAQRDGYAKAEASWPKPRFKWVDGVKVYQSMEDYYND